MADVWDLGGGPKPGAQNVWDLGGVIKTTPGPLTAPEPRVAADIGDAIIAGLQDSSFGWLNRKQAPNVAVGADSPWYHRAAAGVGGVVGDFIPGLVGAVAAVPTGPVGMAAASFAVPMGMREALVEAYTKGHALDWDGVWNVALAGAKGTAKGAVIGAATGGAGRFAAPLVQGAAAKAVVSTSAELTALTTTASALHGKMPTWQDFMDNAILLGGMKGAVATAGTLRSIYAQTGKTPAEVLADAARDPALKEQIADPKLAGEVPAAYRQLALDERVKAALPADKRADLVAEVLRHSEDPTAPSQKDPVRYEYVTDRETAESVVRETATAIRETVEQQRRGTVSVETTMTEATRLVQEGRIDAHKIGDAGNAPELAARALLTKMAAERAKKLADAMPTDPTQHTLEMKLQLAASLEQVGLFYKDLAGAAAEAARAVNMMGQLKRNPALLGDAAALVKVYERKAPFSDVLAAVREMKDPEAVRVFAEGYQRASTLAMVIEAWKAAILSGIHTTGANVLGNVGRFTVEVPSAMLTATIEAGRLAAQGKPMSPSLYAAKAFSPIYGLTLGAKDAFTFAGEAWKANDASLLTHQDVYQRAIPGKTGDVIQYPFRWLRVQDVFFRTFGERAKAYELAVERAGKEFTPGTREFSEAVSKYTTTPQIGLSLKDAQAVTAKIEKHGAEWIYAEQLGPRFEAASRAISGSAAEFVVPFRRTPVNIASWAVQHVPGLNLMSARWRADFAAGGEARSRAVARVIIGSGMAAYAFSLAEQGILTGSGLFDTEARGSKQGAGWQANSLFIDGKYYSLERLEPVAKPLIVAANLYEMMKVAKDKDDKAKIGTMAVLAFSNATISTTYMSGLSNAMKASLEPNRYLDGFIEGYASSLVPKVVGQFVMSADPYKREVDGALEAIQSQVPLLREKLLPKRDVWGEPVPNEKLFAVLPVQTSVASTDKVKTEAARLAILIADAPKTVQERGPFKPSEEQVELTPEQRDIWRQERGRVAMEMLAPLVNHPNWSRIPSYAQAEAYRDAFKKASKAAEFKASPPGDPKRVERREKMTKELIEQINRARGE